MLRLNELISIRELIRLVCSSYQEYISASCLEILSEPRNKQEAQLWEGSILEGDLILRKNKKQFEYANAFGIPQASKV